ncbi:hypothetical protein F2Q69_00027887 [Brassica cretica]|uniref:Uncharacterized protein n=1 Tax=Brassica cretica TaxID=69181 RepID=A0A8S9RY30_BRACR|nr:hypothetical protein F2Q69_00027887 [Brassica cretica]
MTHEEFAAKHPHPPSPVYVNIDRHSDPVIDRHQETPIDRQPLAPIDRGAPLTYRVHMSKIDVERLNALRPKPKPSANSPETVRTPSDDGADPMEVDKVPTGRTLRRRKEKSGETSEEGVNEKEKKTRETEEDIRRMFCEAREQMRKRITLKKKSDPGKFVIPCTVKGIEFPHALINDSRIITACNCGAEYETEYSALIETHTAISIESAQQKSTDAAGEESVDSSQGEWENDYYNPTMAAHNMHTEECDEDYEEERAIEKRATLDEEDRLLHHSFWKEKSPLIDRNGSTSIDTQLHQPNRLQASTDIAYYPSIDTNVNATRDRDYSI